ncbi:MAG: prolipoprotein diacylglyceryl transferase [Rhizomicrobium sp.]|jgi:phosphatidylglycerol:prolipoprotein diacylglycerol transferase
MFEATLPYPNIDPVLLHLWIFSIRWYALSYIAGLLLGWWYALRLIHNPSLWTNPPFRGKAPATSDNIGDLFVWATLGVILGGRLGWVIFYGTILCSVSPHGAMCHAALHHRTLPQDFLTHPIRIISAWEGGMSFHGGMLGTAIAIWLFCRQHKLNTLMVGDIVASVAPIGLFFGRIANFVNGELWGTKTDVPWAMVFCTHYIQVTNGGGCPAGLHPRHPSQLYEAALEGLVLLAILQIGIHKFRWQERPGLTAGVFFLGYGIFRAFVELYREPDAAFLGPISMGQALSSLMWIAGAYFIYLALKKRQTSQGGSEAVR